MTRHRRLIRDARNFESKRYFREQVYNVYRYNMYGVNRWSGSEKNKNTNKRYGVLMRFVTHEIHWIYNNESVIAASRYP